MGGGSIFGLPTKAEENKAKTPQGKVTDTSVLTENAVYRAVQELQKENPGFGKLSTSVALDDIEKKLQDMGFSNISSSHSTIRGPGGAEFLLKHNKDKTGFIVRDKKKK